MYGNCCLQTMFISCCHWWSYQWHFQSSEKIKANIVHKPCGKYRYVLVSCTGTRMFLSHRLFLYLGMYMKPGGNKHRHSMHWPRKQYIIGLVLGVLYQNPIMWVVLLETWPKRGKTSWPLSWQNIWEYTHFLCFCGVRSQAYHKSRRFQVHSLKAHETCRQN